ncbi:hypothetical protein NMG60_11000984 [Bertholletia excelsa]
MTTDDWVAAALTDDAVVVELLFRLKQSSESFASKPASLPLVLPVGWGHRRRRSKPVTVDRKERESTRYSPTTPLSWSCGGGAASSPGDSDHSSGCRSKGTFAIDTSANATNATTSSKRSRKKKTFAELKEEENLLLNERIHLKKELASLRMTLDEQKVRSENLKKLKLDLNLLSANKMAPTSDVAEATHSDQSNLAEDSAPVPFSVSPTMPTCGDCFAQSASEVEKEVETRDKCFILPDLNMTPSEEDGGCDL